MFGIYLVVVYSEFQIRYSILPKVKKPTPLSAELFIRHNTLLQELKVLLSEKDKHLVHISSIENVLFMRGESIESER